MTALRWWIFKRLSAIGWAICPEPHRTNLRAHMAAFEMKEG